MVTPVKEGRYLANILFRDPAGGEGSKVTDLDNVTSILGLPGYEVLSHNERRLCTSLRLHPSLYISYKTCLLRDHLQKKKGQSPKPVCLLGSNNCPLNSVLLCNYTLLINNYFGSFAPTFRILFCPSNIPTGGFIYIII